MLFSFPAEFRRGRPFHARVLRALCDGALLSSRKRVRLSICVPCRKVWGSGWPHGRVMCRGKESTRKSPAEPHATDAAAEPFKRQYNPQTLPALGLAAPDQRDMCWLQLHCRLLVVGRLKPAFGSFFICEPLDSQHLRCCISLPQQPSSLVTMSQYFATKSATPWTTIRLSFCLFKTRLGALD